MRRGMQGKCRWGLIAVAAGVVIIMAIVLPPEFWWFLLAVGLIAAGIWCMKCC